MSQESRRKLLKGLAVTLPAAWTTPMVESIVLPAHAQTSPGGCRPSIRCFAFEVGEGDLSFEWPGGLGPEEEVDLFEGPECDGSEAGPSATTHLVVAESLEAAQDALPCDSGEVVEIETVPALDSGCSFYRCDLTFII